MAVTAVALLATVPSLGSQIVSDHHQQLAAPFHHRANLASATALGKSCVSIAFSVGAQEESATAQIVSKRSHGRVKAQLSVTSELPIVEHTRAIEIANTKTRNGFGLLEKEDLLEPLEDIFRRSPGGVTGAKRKILAERWREYHGSNDWEGLVEPLDADLRSEILKHGEFAQLTYDAFDFDEHSTDCGSCLYDETDLMHEAGLSHRGYEVTKYLYATSDVHLPSWLMRSVNRSEAWSSDSNWMGFVAVATDEDEIARLGRRDIVVAWRGTVTFLEWLEDLDGVLVPITASNNHTNSAIDEDLYTLATGRSTSHAENGIIGVERGFWTLYTSRKETSRYNKQSAAQQVREELRRLLEKYEGEELSITMTGHSLGGALALLSAFDVAATGINRTATATEIPVSVISFAAPKVGNESFKRKLEELRVKALRIVNVQDIVPKVPSTILDGILANFTGGSTHGWAYEHVGVELQVDNRDSHYLKKTWDLADCHNLEVYLHLVDAYKSTQESFVEELQSRDLALVNKSSSLLINELNIPPHWLHKPKDGSHAPFDANKASLPDLNTLLPTL